MKIAFPSEDFDSAVAAVCHGAASEAQAEALGEVLRENPDARDAYIRRVAVHAALASRRDLFAGAADDAAAAVVSANFQSGGGGRSPGGPGWRSLALAAAIVVLLGAGAWLLWRDGGNRRGETSRAVAMLNRVVNARWSGDGQVPRLGAPLEPGDLKLESGLAQIVFYNGARVVIEGPAELRLISSTEAACQRGTLTAEAPPQAKGFRVIAPGLDVIDLGTAFGIKVRGDRSELHVFEGRVAFRTEGGAPARNLLEGQGAVVEGTGAARLITADPSEFSGLFDLQAKSVAADARRYDNWRDSIRNLRRDPSLWIHLDFEHGGAPAWRLLNAGSLGGAARDATVVGCEWREGRWATKPALEFRGISDRVRLMVPGELESATLAAWVRVQGLDRQINSLFMSDGFHPGTLHWVIRNDGVLGLTVIGDRGEHHQILASPPVITFDQFGIWTHLAVVVDGPAREAAHYVNGRQVSRHTLQVAGPFWLGSAELGNWHASGYPGNDPFLIRNFSGAMDEFCLFSRALSPGEISDLYEQGRPQSEEVAALSP